jgi:hypothetical protein
MKRLRVRPIHSRSACGTTLRSDDGVIAFTLERTARGLFVERVQLRADTARVVQSMLFTDDKSFDRWCDTDAVRFDYPVVYINLKRNGDALLGQTG